MGISKGYTRQLSVVLKTTTVDGYVNSIDKKVVLNTRWVKRYFNSLYSLIGISEGSILLLEYYLEIMNRDNEIMTGLLDIKKYISVVRRISKGNIVYSVSGVRWCLHDLRVNNIIIPYVLDGNVLRGRGVINPLFYYSGTDKNRINLIKSLFNYHATGGIMHKVILDYNFRISLKSSILRL